MRHLSTTFVIPTLALTELPDPQKLANNHVVLTMSEKTDLELQANSSMPKLSLEQKDPSPQPPKKTNSLRPRLWKAICILECHFMASFLHGYAIAHAQKAHLTGWDEVMVPDVENLVDWIKLFVVYSNPACPVEILDRTWC